MKVNTTFVNLNSSIDEIMLCAQDCVQNYAPVKYLFLMWRQQSNGDSYWCSQTRKQVGTNLDEVVGSKFRSDKVNGCYSR